MEEDIDEDVVMKGSPLYEHLVGEGFIEKEVEEKNKDSIKTSQKLGQPERKCTQNDCNWPMNASNLELEINVAKRILQSELLVQEDEDFICNFILSEDALAALEENKAAAVKANKRSSQINMVNDALLYSGSLAAAAAAVLYLSSEKTRLVATLATAVPAALAVASSVFSTSSSDSKNDEPCDESTKELDDIVEQLLTSMKRYKQLIRKSLNLIQGMELMHSGYTLAVNSETGATLSSGDPNLERSSDYHKNVCFPALRRAAYKSTVDLIKAYRKSIQDLMDVSPLVDHVDMKEHYLAFVSLEEFGIIDLEEGDLSPVSDHIATIKELRDVIQLGLVQQSEYLRRFSLAFSDKVREDLEFNRSGLIKQVQNVISTLKRLNLKLTKVFDYHQAMGVVNERRNSTLMEKRKEAIGLIPLRSVYTSLFTTGLYLQNSLLKVRQLEKAFDSLEKKNSIGSDTLNALLPSENSLLEWLKEFQNIQNELGACIGCLDEGVSQIDLMQLKKNPRSISEAKFSESISEGAKVKLDSEEDRIEAVVQKIDASTMVEPMDEVFEAFIESDPSEAEYSSISDGVSLSKEQMLVKKMMRELRDVLQVRAQEHQQREAEALARQGKVSTSVTNSIKKICLEHKRLQAAFLINCNDLSDKESCETHSGFEDSFADPPEERKRLDSFSSNSSSSSSSQGSNAATVKSISPNNNELEPFRSHDLGLSNESINHEDGAARPLSAGVDRNVRNGLSHAAFSVDSLSLNNSAEFKIPPKSHSCSLSELRSISSPDLKNMAKNDQSNPYLSFEALQDDLLLDSGASSDSDDNKSADEMQHQVLKTYRRPLRPAARMDKAANNRSQKKSVILSNGNANSNEHEEVKSFYVNRHNSKANPLFLPPSAPVGLNAQVAREAASKFHSIFAKKNEEVFGSDSD